MSKFLKIGILAAVVISFFLLGFYFYSFQNTNTFSTEEVEFIKDNTAVGETRAETNEQGYLSKDNVNNLSKDELVTEVVGELSVDYHKTPYDIRLDYFFYDENNEVTRVEEDVKGIRYRVQFVKDN